jgi:hypothetical protein
MYARGDLTDEDTTFRRWQGGGFATHLSFEPVDGLYIGAGLGSVGMSRSFAGEFQEDGFVNALKNAQVGLGYTIPDVGFVRAQWIGINPQVWGQTAAASSTTEWVQDTPANTSSGKWETTATAATYGWTNTIDKPLNGTGAAGKIQGAFNLKAIKDIDVDIGFSIPLADERDYWNDLAKTTKTKTVTTQGDYVFSAGFDINVARPFRLWGLMSLKTGGYNETTEAGATTKVSTGTDFAIVLTPMYYLENGFILIADIFFDTRSGSDAAPARQDGDPTVNPDAGAKNNYVDLGFGAYIRKNIPGGDIRAGVTVKLPGVSGEGHEGAKPQIFIPVMFNYGF